MAETVSVDLELIDKIGGPAKRAADALRRVETQATKASQAATRQAERQAAAAERVALRSSMAQMRATKTQMALEERAARHKEASTRRLGLMQLAAQEMDRKRTQQRSFGAGVKRALGLDGMGGKMATGAFWGNLAASAVSTIGGAFIEGAEQAVSLLGKGIKGAFKAGADYEDLKLSYKLLLGPKNGSAALDDISRFSGKTRYDDDEIAQMMRPLFNAGLRGTGARTAFAASADLNAAGLGDTREFIEAFAKIQLKGGVSEKMLQSMSVPVRRFKDDLARITKLDKETAFDRAKEGKLDPMAIQNAIVMGIERRQGGQVGSGAEEMGKTMGAQWHKITALPQNYLKVISDSPAWGQLSDKLGDVLTQLDPSGPNGQKIIGRLIATFERVSGSIKRALTPENIDKFVAGIQRGVDTMGRLVTGLETLVSWEMKLLNGLEKITKLVGYAADVADAMSGKSQVESYIKAHPEGDWLGRTDTWKSLMSAVGAENEPVKPLGSGDRTVHVNQTGMTIHVTAAPGEDPHETGKRIGAGIGQGLDAGVIRRMERAAQERGGG